MFKSVFLFCAYLFSVSVFGQQKPNVVVIITDDQAYQTIHALGNKEIVTPNMDRLVESGTAFTNAHIMGGMGGAICQPSRAMLLSSRTLFHLHRDGDYIPESDVTFPELFRNNGYITFQTGKWHQDTKTLNRGFIAAENILLAGMNPPETGGQYRPRLFHFDSSGKYDKPFWGTTFSSVYFADAAVRFIESQRMSTQPFMMYVAFSSPHDPRTAPTWYGHSYHPNEVSLPANYLPEHPFDNGELRIRDEMLVPFPRTKDVVKTEIAKYYAMISEVDYQIGRILDELKKTGKDKNTIVVFAGDNGLAVGQHGLMGKQNPYESSIRVPLIFSGPGIPKGKKENALVYLNDIYPTLCEMTNMKIPATVEGRSMAVAFSGKTFQGNEDAFFAYINLQRVYVKGNFKLVHYNVNGEHPVQFFDLKNDPHEMNNLAQNPLYQAKIKEMTMSLDKRMKYLDDFCDLDKPDWGARVKWRYEEVLKLNP